MNSCQGQDVRLDPQELLCRVHVLEQRKRPPAPRGGPEGRSAGGAVQRPLLHRLGDVGAATTPSTAWLARAVTAARSRALGASTPSPACRSPCPRCEQRSRRVGAGR
jgi:hypothetical protein